MILQRNNVRQLVWRLHYVDTAVEGSELYCYNTEGDRNSVVSQASCRMDAIHKMSKFIQDEPVVFDKIHIVGSGLWTL